MIATRPLVRERLCGVTTLVLGEDFYPFHSVTYAQLPFYRVDISTNQPAVQMYTAYWLNTPRKEVHGGPSQVYGPWAAIALEQQGYVDAINTPEWDVNQICTFI
jgi:galactose mutarotase-like enzyme